MIITLGSVLTHVGERLDGTGVQAKTGSARHVEADVTIAQVGLRAGVDHGLAHGVVAHRLLESEEAHAVVKATEVLV